ncbi:MAG: thiamine phosphate synthase [Nitrospiraceae bacterium]|nr:thiamine phosphate synthase [Nitrospiraceae bacterium]
MTLNIPSVFFISDAAGMEIVPKLLDAGIRGIQLRDKNISRRRLYESALELRELTSRYRAMFIVNDYPDLAVASDADGVHLGQDDLPLHEARKIMAGRIIGISTHSMQQAQDAFRAGADYIGFGPVFTTSTKNAGDPKGTDELQRVAEAVGIPVIAIGGINQDNVDSVAAAGCSSVAVISALMGDSPDIKAARFLSAFNRDK